VVHGEWQPSSDRPGPVGLLEEQAASRVQELVPIRHGRILVSPFTLLPLRCLPNGLRPGGGARTGLSVQLCGDAHLSNFGVFAAPDRRLVFSVNDFDQTLPGPFEWDVKRLVASFAVAGTDRGFDTKQRKVDQPGYGPVLSEAMLDLADEKARCLVCPPGHRGDRRSAEGAGEEGPGEAVRAERGQSPDGSSQCRFASASISRVAPRTRSSPR
jgi:Uncharacterized protein conserved in bacteria (DUF2252)